MTTSPDRRPSASRDVDDQLELLVDQLEALTAKLLDLVRRLRERAAA